MNCAQLLRRANELKKQLSEGQQGDLRVIRYNLQNVYRELLVTDLEYALDKKLEQELWNNIFKNHISSLQARVRDKMNPKRSELQSMLTLTLDSATGFFLQLLHELCAAFDLELPFCVKASRFGVTRKLRQYQKVVVAQLSSCLYICQYCLVHLGDLARYRNDTDQAHMFYNHAVTLIPTNGQPYNQLAIVSASKSDQLSMTFYYIRSIAVKHPFPAALTNLQSTFSKLVDRDEMKIFKMRDVELIHYFIKFHAVIYMASGESDLKIASNIKAKLEENFRDHLNQDSLTAKQLVQIVAINIFALCSVKQLDENGALTNKKTEDGVSVQDNSETADEEECWKLTLDLTVTLAQLLLYHAPSSSKDGFHWIGLPAIRVLLQWLKHQPKVLADETVTEKYLFWHRLGKLLSTLYNIAPNYKERDTSSILWEDTLLNGFRLLEEAHSELDFSSTRAKHPTKSESNQTRLLRVIASGVKLATLQPRLLKFVESEATSFTSPLHDAQAEQEKYQHIKVSKTATSALRLKTQTKQGKLIPERDEDLTNMTNKDADDEEDDDDDVEKLRTVATQVIEPKPSKPSSQETSEKRTRVSFNIEKNMVIPPPAVSQQPHHPSPSNHPSQQTRPHFPPHMPRGYPVHYPRQGPPQQMPPHQGPYPSRTGWGQSPMQQRPPYPNYRGPPPPQQVHNHQAPNHGPQPHHGPQQHHGHQTQGQHGPQPPHGLTSHGPQTSHGHQHMPPHMWQQPPPRHMPPFMGNQPGPRYPGPHPVQNNRQPVPPQNYPSHQQHPMHNERPTMDGDQGRDGYQPPAWNSHMMPQQQQQQQPQRGYVHNGPMRLSNEMPSGEGRMSEQAERDHARSYDGTRGMAHYGPHEFKQSSYHETTHRQRFGSDGGPPNMSYPHGERNGPVGSNGMDVFYDQRNQKSVDDEEGTYMNLLNSIHQSEREGKVPHQRPPPANMRDASGMDPHHFQKPHFNSDYQRQSSGDDFGTFSPHHMSVVSPSARSPSQSFFDDGFKSRQPDSDMFRQRKSGSPWNDAQVSSNFNRSDQLSPGISKPDDQPSLALLHQLMTPPSEGTVGRNNWSTGLDDRSMPEKESDVFSRTRSNRTPPFAGPSWLPESPGGNWAGGQELQFPDQYPSSPQEFLKKDDRVVGRRLSGSLTESDNNTLFTGSDSSYSLFSSPSPWSDKSNRDSFGASSPFGSLHQKDDEKQGSSNLFGGLAWGLPQSDQISGSPTSGLLPERIQSIWSSPLSGGEPSGMETTMRDKPDT